MSWGYDGITRTRDWVGARCDQIRLHAANRPGVVAGHGATRKRIPVVGCRGGGDGIQSRIRDGHQIFISGGKMRRRSPVEVIGAAAG